MDEALIRLQEEELQRTGRYYKHICFLCVPLLCVSCYLYGLRPLLLCGFAVLMGNLCDRLISLLRRRVYQAGDYSNESFALVITLLMPATVDWYVLAAAILAGALIGKEVFGGYGSYPFHPAAVGYAVAAVSWPEQVFRYPAPYANIPLWDASGWQHPAPSRTPCAAAASSTSAPCRWCWASMPPRWGPVQPSCWWPAASSSGCRRMCG